MYPQPALLLQNPLPFGPTSQTNFGSMPQFNDESRPHPMTVITAASAPQANTRGNTQFT
jgi:hypothetical protein